MIATILLSSLLAAQAASNRVPAFQPRLHPRIQPTPANVLAARRALEEREIVCGMVVIHKTPADDWKFLLPARETGAVIRRIEPQGCTAKQTAPGK